MYCPKCGAAMLKTPQGAYSCEPGGMELTPDLNRRLTECYVSEIRQPTDMRFDVTIGGQWFCPGCGLPITEAGGDLRCSRCNRNLAEFVWALIEHCYHAQ